MAKGFLQKLGLDYQDVFSLVAKIESVRLIVVIIAFKSWKMYQLDVKSTFLNGPLEEKVYVKQPPGFKVTGYKHKAYKLNKALYGLKQALRAWNKKNDSFFIQNSIEKYSCEYGLYVKVSKYRTILLVCLYGKVSK